MSERRSRMRALIALAAALVLAVALTACGGDDDDGDAETAAGQIEANPDNADVRVTVGSKNFTEQIVLGEIYAQALEAAGYTVDTDLNLGSEVIALRSLEEGEVDAYPEYTSTALTSFFDVDVADVPRDPDEAFTESQSDFAELGLIAFPPTPFTSANAVGLLTETADDLGVSSVSELADVAGDLTLAGSPECRQRVDCLVGLEREYGLEFGRFTPVDIGLRYEVLDERNADLSILFTTDAQLRGDDYAILEDDLEIMPAGNVMLVATEAIVEQAGEDFGATVELVQDGLSEEVMQELNARVDIDRERPADVAEAYLRESGYID